MTKATTTAIVCLMSLLATLVPVGVTWATPSVPPGDLATSAEHVDTLAITSVSPWVSARGTFEVTFSTAGLPADAVVRTTIHQRLRTNDSTLREVVESQMHRDSAPRNLQAPISTPLAELGTSNGSATLVIPIRPGGGDPQRQLVPTPGIHPVTIEVLSLDGPSDEQVSAIATVFLNRLPDEMPEGRDGKPATTSVQLLAALDSTPALGVYGQADLSTEESLAVSAWAAMLTENRDLPLTVAMRPNTLLGLQRGSEPTDVAFVEGLHDTAFTVATQPYVKVDSAAVIASNDSALTHQVTTGGSILTALTGEPPAGIWMFDDTVDTAAARHLLADGVNHLFVSQDRLTVQTGNRRREESPLETNRIFEVAGVEGMTVSSYDATVTRLLLESDLPPGLRAHRGATALMATWFDAVQQDPESFPGVSSAIVLSPGTDHDVLSEFVSALSEPGPLGVAAPTVATVDDGGAPLLARLGERNTDPVSGVLDHWRRTAQRIAGFASMRPPQDPAAGELNLLNDQTPALDADAATRSALWEQIDSVVEDQLAEIQTPPPRSVVLTSRSGLIPLRLRNRGEVPVTVRMTTRSPRLEFPQGATRDIVLKPGENPIDIPVEVQAPGSSLLRIDLTSPDGVLHVREVQVNVRSSSISGVGAVLSTISLLVLGLWWILTFRRRRHSTDDNPADNDPADNDSGAAGGSDKPGAGRA